MTQQTMHRYGVPLALTVATIAVFACTSRESATADSAAIGADGGAAVTPTPLPDTTRGAGNADTTTPAPTPPPARQPRPQPDTSKRRPITDQPVKSDPQPPTTPPAVRPT